MNTFIRIGLLFLTCTLSLTSSVFAQGSLIPPGAPAPTMQTLDQLGAKTDQANTKLDQANAKLDQAATTRINLQAAPAAAGVVTSDVNNHFIITKAGSYYLSANLGVTKPNGIDVAVAGVTIDLNGFQISRDSGTAGDGITIEAAAHHCTIKNGSISGFAYGILSVFGGGLPRSCAFRDLRVSGCTSSGIVAGEGAVLESCRVHGNSGSYAIFVGPGSSLSNCTATNNTGTHGIYAESGSSLSNCTASNNTGTYGIYAVGGSTLSNCSAYSNDSAAATSAGIGTGSSCTVTNCASINNTSSATSSPTTGMGFAIGVGSTIQKCAARNNEGDGINLSSDSVARENTCDSNGSSGDGAGIHATSADNRIEGNNVTDNDRGIDVDAAGNLIIKNSASGNTANFVIAGNNVFGSIVDRTNIVSVEVTGNGNGGGSLGTTDPWANFLLT